MTLIQGFNATEPFFDDEHFPHGFRKSGDFSIAEAQLLTDIGKRLLMLEHGQCAPENDVEEQFVKMCRNAGEPQTKAEVLWGKYKKLTKYKVFHSLNGHVPTVNTEE